MSERPGKSVGAYELEELLGEGQLAVVYKAYHRGLDRHVALKLLRPDVAPGSEPGRRFQQVARRVAALDHPNIVPVHDYAEFHNIPYQVQKLIEGESLKSRLARGPLTLAETSRMLGAVGSALHYVHGQGQAHGALRPSNILLGTDGTVYVSDVGAGLPAGSGSGLLYRSPEQWRQPGLESAESDQYALGLILYEALTGSLPPSLLDKKQPGARSVTRELPRASAVVPALDEAADEVILKALARHPPRRHPNVRTFVHTFQRLTAPPRPPTAPLRLDTSARLPWIAPAQPKIGAKPADITVMLAMPGGHVFRLTGRNEYTLGRADPEHDYAPDLDLSEWRASESGVSRQHGRLHFDDSRLFYTDLNSSNGSSINGARMGSQIPVLLEDGDELGLGQLSLRVYFGSENDDPSA